MRSRRSWRRAPRGSTRSTAYARELRTRGASPATLRAYGRDLLELGAWATERGREPGELAYRDLRGFAASLSERRLARSSVARKLAAARSFHTHLVDTGAAAANPADLLPSPKRESRLPRVLGREQVAALLDRIPTRTPLELRDRAMFELAYSCGLRAAEIVSLDLGDPDFETETLRVTGKGNKTRLSRSASPLSALCVPTWRPPARRSGPRRRPRRRCSSPAGPAAVAL